MTIENFEAISGLVNNLKQKEAEIIYFNELLDKMKLETNGCRIDIETAKYAGYRIPTSYLLSGVTFFIETLKQELLTLQTDFDKIQIS